MSNLNLSPDDLLEYYGGPGGNTIEYSADVWPSTYLEFARNDLIEGNENRQFVNAVTNAKRAFHYQIESLSDAFAIKKYQRNKLNIHHRLDFLQKCGVISPNILKKLNRTRNLVEHEYYIPTEDEAQDYVDIVELFLHATKVICDIFPTSMGLEILKDEQYDKSKNLPEELEIRIKDGSGVITILNGDLKKTITTDNPDYLDWVSNIVWHYFA